MKVFRIESLDSKQLESLSLRQAINMEDKIRQADVIIKDVKRGGDKTLRNLTQKFDGVLLDDLKVREQDFIDAEKRLSAKLKESLIIAKQNIYKFHSSQIIKERVIKTMPGVYCYQKALPIEKAGLYIPGGLAPLPSTVLMLAVPAIIAGCDNIVICTPPQRNGKVADSVLFSAKICGVKDIYAIGGAQAIAAMAYGTKTVPKVNKIFGPGNQYVTAAKMLVSIDPEGAAIDMPAGPSEVMVIADSSANAKWVASDLISQAEHGIDSQSVLLTDSQDLVNKVLIQMEKQIKNLPRRELAEVSLSKSFALIVNNFDEAFDFANMYASEHLIINIKKYNNYISKIKNAGSVFLGPYSAESIGDYASGTNHSLPTYGYAKSFSGVSCESFLKKVSFQRVTKYGLRNIADIVKTIAEAEGLEAHKRAVEFRS